MKVIGKCFAIGGLAFLLAACATQNNQGNANAARRPQGRQQGPPSYTQLLTQMDANKDGKLSKIEVQGPLQRDFATIDSNSDGFITQTELENAPQPQRGQGPSRN